jgi:RimJ/RimL family protein N-acetyltransferase
MNNTYKVLNTQIFTIDSYSIVPIRYEDRWNIMQWRNEQMYHLRQNKKLKSDEQDVYFKKVVSQLFEIEQPNQILFSFLDGNKCIGYGGLVHINWVDKNAEISFIMDTQLEKDYFSLHWKTYLKLIEKVAFDDLKLHKIYTFAFDLRPHLYTVLENSGYKKEAILEEHCFFEDKFMNVVIHSKTQTSK